MGNDHLAQVIVSIIGFAIAVWPIIKLAQLVIGWLRPITRFEFDALSSRVLMLENYKAHTEEMRSAKMEIRIRELTDELKKKDHHA